MKAAKMKRQDHEPHAGMTVEALLEQLGEPAFVLPDCGAENWIYITPYGELRVRVVRYVTEIVELGEDEEA